MLPNWLLSHSAQHSRWKLVPHWALHHTRSASGVNSRGSWQMGQSSSRLLRSACDAVHCLSSVAGVAVVGGVAVTVEGTVGAAAAGNGVAWTGIVGGLGATTVGGGVRWFWGVGAGSVVAAEKFVANTYGRFGIG